jgi:hypothetical protein
MSDTLETIIKMQCDLELAKKLGRKIRADESCLLNNKECHHDHCIGSDELGVCSCRCHKK